MEFFFWQMKEHEKRYNYMTWREVDLFGFNENGRKWFDMAIAIGLGTCETIGDVLELLQDVRQHERDIQTYNKLKRTIKRLKDCYEKKSDNLRHI